MKKVLALLLVLAIALSLCACGAKSETPAADNTPSEAPKGSTEQEAKDIAGGATEADKVDADPEDDKYGGSFVTSEKASVASGCLFYPYNYAGAFTYIYPAVEQLGLRTAKGTYEPWLCDSWDVDIEAKTTTLHLRQGVMFHDGSELTAEVVKWNLDKIIEYGNGSVIKDPTSIEVVDKYTLKVTWKDFNVDQDAALYQVPIYSQKAFEDHGLEWCINNVVGTGPFEMVEYEVDSHLTFKRFDNYWQEGKPYLDEYKIQIIPDEANQMTAFVNGEIDRFQSTNMQISKTMFDMGYENKAIIGEPNSSQVFSIYANNTIEGDPWSDVRVRQALLLYGIDWSAVGYVAGGQLAYTLVTPLVEMGPGYDPTLMEDAQYDLEKAKGLLAEAGYADGFKTNIFAYDYVIPAATEIQSQLKKNYNIDAEVIEMVAGDERYTNGVNPGVYLCNGYSTIDFGKYFNIMFNTNAYFKDSMKFTDEFLAKIDLMFNAKSKEEKADYIRELSRMLFIDQCLFREMYAVPNVIFIQDYVHDSGLERTIDGLTPQDAWLDPEYR